MTPDAIAERYGQRPGFELVSYREVGLPIYRLSLAVMMIDAKELPVMTEFLMRSITAGFDTVDAAAAFLGLEDFVVRAALFDLHSDDLVRVEANATAERLVLTAKGSRALETLRLVQPEERPCTVDYDGLLRRPVPWRGWLMKPRDVRDAAMQDIPAIPPEPPGADEISAHAVHDVLLRKDRRQATRQVLSIARVARRERFFVPAIMLIFRASVGDEVQASFVIDGRPSPDHDQAFAIANGVELLGLVEGTRPNLTRHAEEVFGSQRAALLAEKLQTKAAMAALSSTSEEPKRGEPVELLATYDHPRLLSDALEKSAELLVIVSPWIKDAIVDSRFVSRLVSRLESGTKVFIGYGLGEGVAGNDPAAVRTLERLAGQHANLTVRRFGDTHAKVLISDRRYVVTTSFNWLSFRGDPSRAFRDERGTLVRAPTFIDTARETILARFAA